jgi:hypothetical protein
MKEATDLKMGDAVWVFDRNRRIYNGSGMGAKIIWREYFREQKIIGENRTSWLVGFEAGGYVAAKIPKNGKFRDRSRLGFAFSREEIDQRAFVEENRVGIADALRLVDDYATVKAIADLIGYKARA